MCIVIVKELNKEYFTTIKRFVYVSVIIKLNFENPKTGSISENKKNKKNKKSIFKFMSVLVLIKLRFLHKNTPYVSSPDMWSFMKFKNR